MFILSSLWWQVYRRPALIRKKVFADKRSYVDRESVLGGFNRLGRGALILKSTIGRYTYVDDVRIVACDVGAFCSVGSRVIVGLGSHPTRWISTHPAFYSTRLQAGATFASSNLFSREIARTAVGNDVWIGAGAMIMAGVRIGDGAVIAAGAVVTRDVGDYQIVGGVPAKTLGYRFDPEVIAELLQWRWWDLPDSVLARLPQPFSATDAWSVAQIRSLRHLADR